MANEYYVQARDRGTLDSLAHRQMHPASATEPLDTCDAEW